MLKVCNYVCVRSCVIVLVITKVYIVAVCGMMAHLAEGQQTSY